jgi:basic amino acid/polyamine antiporter, APA family
MAGPLRPAPAESSVSAPQLRGDIGRFQYLALGFGTMIGSAWVILLGDWLGKAGPGGAVLGFLAGGVVIVLVGACYAELAARLPEAGSEFVYARRVYGRGLAFSVGWFLILYLLSVTVFEALAFAWIVETVLPGTPSLPVGIGAALVITALNLRGAQLAVISHTFLTYSFFAVVVSILLLLLANGTPHNATPLFAATNDRNWWLGSGAIFAFCAYALNGFQTIPHAVEERSGNTTLRAIGWIIVGSICAAAAFYCLVVIAASVIVPWQELVAAPLPMVAAVRNLPHGDIFALVLLIATAASLLKAWNGVFMMAVRLLVAMARAGCVPGVFARLHPRFQSPAAAVLAAGGCTIAGIFLGKGAIGPITDMSAMVLTLTYGMCCWTVLRIRRRGLATEAVATRAADAAAADFARSTAVGAAAAIGATAAVGAHADSDAVVADRPHTGAPAWLIWLALIGSACMAACAFLAPFWQQPGFPLEYQLLAAWGALGMIVWRYALTRPSDPGSPSTPAPSSVP